MRIHYFQHVPFEGLGNIEEWIKFNNYSLSATRFYSGEPLPELAETDWLIIMGGPMGVYDEDQYPWLRAEKEFVAAAIRAGKKVLGICLGAQLIAAALGEKVYPHSHREIGWYPLKLTDAGKVSEVLGGFPDEFAAFHWHGDTFNIPRGAVHLATTDACRNQAFIYGKKVVALQFHWDVRREGVGQLIENCARELTGGPYVQTPRQMLLPEKEFGEIQQYMNKVLTYLSSQP